MIQLAVAGAGAWGRNHIRSLAGMRRARLTWVVEPDAKRRSVAQALAPRARVTGDEKQALSDPDLDALVVASPTPTHVPVARAALAYGKHVLVEKPLAETATEAWDLVRRARKAGCHLLVGHLLLYHPAVRRLKRMVEAGQLGEIRYLHSRRTNLGRVRTDEGALWGLAPHDISIMVHLLGAWPTSVSAQGARYVQPEWEDLVFLTLRFPGGILGHVHLSWLDALKVRRTSVVGSRRMAAFDDMDPRSPLLLCDAPGRRPRTQPVDVTGAGQTRPVRVLAGQPLRLELEAFVKVLEGREVPLTPGEDGARVVKVLEAAQRSLKEGGARIPVRIRTGGA